MPGWVPLEKNGDERVFVPGRVARAPYFPTSGVGDKLVGWVNMIIFAEISDKMPTIPGMWAFAVVVGLIFAAFARAHRLAAVMLFPITLAAAVFFAWIGYHEAFLEDSFREAIWSELGFFWVATSIAAPFLPFCAVVAVLIFIKRDINTDRLSIGNDTSNTDPPQSPASPGQPGDRGV